MKSFSAIDIMGRISTETKWPISEWPGSRFVGALQRFDLGLELSRHEMYTTMEIGKRYRGSHGGKHYMGLFSKMGSHERTTVRFSMRMFMGN